MSKLNSFFEKTEKFKPIDALGRPIFRSDLAKYAVFYAPGIICVTDILNADRFEASLGPIEVIEQIGITSDPITIPGLSQIKQCHMNWANQIWRYAEQAMEYRPHERKKPFEPECLTLFMNNECNLECIYCYTNPSKKPAFKLDLKTVSAGAQFVAANCRKKNLPLTVVFHGGGEPTLYKERVDQIMDLLKKISHDHEVQLFTYVATNGIVSEKKALWLAHRFDMVGLSCDGPSSIQNRQRPILGGKPSSFILERTGHILSNEGCRTQIRATITNDTICKQTEIAEYICHQFRPEEIRFEPVYKGGLREEPIELVLAENYVNHFLQAKVAAGKFNIPLSNSGSRLDSIHGPYCNIFRSVLNLIPQSLATACFKLSDRQKVIQLGAHLGKINPRTNRFEVDSSNLKILREKLGFQPPYCDDCFNQYHCNKECPDRCPLDTETYLKQIGRGPGFRCHVQKAIIDSTLKETAKGIWEKSCREKGHDTHDWIVSGKLLKIFQ